MTIQGTRRPLVVLAGWLGGRVSQLKRYEQLYQSMGLDTFSMVVSTVAIVDCTLTMQQEQRQRQLPAFVVSNHHSSSPPVHETPQPPRSLDSTIQDWAWYTLQTIHDRQPPYYFVHVFSNGGCFLWESICRILEQHSCHGINVQQPDDDDDKSQNTSPLSQNQVQPEPVLTQLATTCHGIIFDSCPAWFGADPSGLWTVLQQHCSAEDIQQVMEVFGEDRLRLVPVARNQEYFDYLTYNNTSMSIPQLYLYSIDDPLSNADSIAKLVQERRKQQLRLVRGRSCCPIILEYVWEQSMHCAHLRQHPEEYRQAIIEFVQLATTFQSKL
jgi:hypothetical protein